MKKIVMSEAALQGFKQMIAESDEPLTQIEKLGAMLVQIASGQPLPASAQDRALDANDPDDAELIEEIGQDPASNEVAMSFAEPGEIVAWLKKECGYAH